MKTPAYNCFKQQPRSSHSLAPRMAVRFSEIWLLIGVVFVVHLPVTRCQLCPQDSTFHDRTGSCIGLIRKYFTYGEAFYYCRDNFRGNTTKKDGHLVFIFDQATDEFVKGLLDEHDALIGLTDRAINGNYAWGDHNAIIPTYTAWADNPHTPDPSKYAVVMTKDGWQEYGARSEAYFVCQVSVDFPTPRIVCPAAEVGKQSPSITCTTDTHTSLSVTGVRSMKTAKVVASCNANRCWPSLEYGQAVDVSNTPETRYSASWTLQLRNVRISDATDWTCSVEFSNTGYWVASQTCRLSVYKKPTDIQCVHQFVEETVRTTCTAAQVYPQVGCQWTVSYGTRSINVYDPTVSNDVATTDGYTKATCSASFYVTNAGIYHATVAMVPKVLNFQIEAVTKTISLSVERPQQPPKLSLAGRVLQSLWVELVENQTLSLTCQVTGGDPEVYRTIITCDNISPPFGSYSNSVTMKVPVTRQLNGQSCTCSALHAASYTQTSSVVIRVAYPAAVTSFRVARSNFNTPTDIQKGDKMTFSCWAVGNPIPQLILQRLNGHTVTNSSTGDVTYQKTATCSDTGKYVCLASNRPTVQSQPHEDSREVHLQVRCAPEHCRGEPSVSLPVAVGDQPAIIKMCVRAFPAPTSFSLYKGNTTSNMLKADKFQAYFNFTNEEEGLGEITVKISPLTQEDLGDYTLYSEYRTRGVVKLYSYLMFSLFPQGPPMCPTNFTLVKAGPDSVTLTWTPGFNGGLNQTFKVLHVDSPNSTTTAEFTMLGTVEGQEDSSVYAVTGLSEGTEYTFRLEVRNEIGTRNCSHLQVTVTTSGPPMCPTHFTLVKAGPDSVTLTWIPGFNGGLNQTFKVLHVDSPNATTTAEFTMLGAVEGQEDSNVYAVTGLSEGTEYTFGLEVRNEIGTGNCSHLQVTVFTSDQIILENGVFPAPLVGAIVAGIVAAKIIIITIVVLKRKGSCRVVEEPPEPQSQEDPHYTEIIDFQSDMPESHVHDPHRAPGDSPYLEIIDFQSDMPESPVHDPHRAPEDSPYLEIIDMSDNPAQCPQQLLNAYDDVEYENTVSGL